eukprot:c30164_g1_i1 orf=374-865(+)
MDTMGADSQISWVSGGHGYYSRLAVCSYSRLHSAEVDLLEFDLPLPHRSGPSGLSGSLVCSFLLVFLEELCGEALVASPRFYYLVRLGWEQQLPSAGGVGAGHSRFRASECSVSWEAVFMDLLQAGMPGRCYSRMASTVQVSAWWRVASLSSLDLHLGLHFCS